MASRLREIARLLTIRRLRIYTLLIAVTIWAVYAIDMSGRGPLDRLGKVKGTDFLQFYVLGSIVHEGRWSELYDASTLASRAHALAPDSSETIYPPLQSPQVALFAAPLAALPYETALAVWIALTLATCAVCSLLLWRECRALHEYPAEALAACAAFPGFFAVVVNGQLSFAALACVVAAMLALRRGRRLQAGFALGLLVFKPHWAAASAAVFAAAGEPAVVAGLVGGAAIETAAVALLVPRAVMNAYAWTLAGAAAMGDLLEARPGESLKGFFKVMLPSGFAPLAAYVVASIVVVVAAAKVWRSAAPFELRASAVLVAVLLISPHSYAYDLVLVAPVLFLMAAWFSATEAPAPSAAFIPPLLAALFVGPMLGALPAAVRLLFTAGAMSVLLACCVRLSAPRSCPTQDAI